MTRRFSVLLVLLSATLALLAPAPASAGPGESEFVSRINSERRSRGIPAYAVRSDLTAVARRHAARMASRGRIYHNPNLGSEVSGWRSVGENVGKGPSVSAIHSAFMNSSSHRSNILSRGFSEVGVGTVTSGSTIYVVEVFRLPSGARVAPAPTRKPAPRVTARPTTRSSRTRRPAAPPAATTRPPVRRVPVISPAALLAARVSTARLAWAATAPASPFEHAFSYVSTMRTLAG